MRASPVSATTIPLSDIPLGKVVSVNGLKFIKIAENQYMAAEQTCMLSVFTPQQTMQGWTGCASLATPTFTAGIKSTYFTQGPTLVDARDCKKYEIRKFPDGKCWMVDNLRYGGQTDNCNGRTTFDGTANKSGSSWGYGDCRDPHQGGSAPCNTNTASGVPQCGYYYNWQAAMQASGAYYNVNYTTPSYPHQGICPTGWHVPAGWTTITASEFLKLHNAVGGGATDTSNSSTPYTAFWKPTSTTSVTTTDPWKGIYSGYSDSSGGLGNQSRLGYWWSSTEASPTGAYNLGVYTSSVNPQNGSNKNLGFTVRCVKN
jgi:uncharacterized protein (TIGR02145 family)